MNKYDKIAKRLELEQQIKEALIGMMVPNDADLKVPRVIGSSVGPVRVDVHYSPALFAKRLAKEIADNL